MAADAALELDTALPAADRANEAGRAGKKSKGKGKAKDGSRKRKASDAVDADAPASAVDGSRATSDANGAIHEAHGGEDGADAGEDDDERPLSRKERRQAKKRKLAAEAAGDDEAAAAPSKPPKASTSTSSSQPAATSIGSTLVGNTPSRSAHGVWVGNLNFATHPRELLQWFKERGLEEVTRINMPGGKRQHENNRGFAYLDFPSATDVTIAVGLSEQHLDGRKLLIKSSTDYTGRPAPAASTSTAGTTAGAGTVKEVLSTLDSSALERHHPASASAGGPSATGGEAAPPPPTLNRTARKILSRQKNPAGPTLFLGNLGFETTVDDIRDMFDRNQRRGREWAKGGVANDEDEEREGGAENVGEREGQKEEDNDEAASQGEGGDEKKAGGDKEKRDQKKRKREKGAPLDLAKAKDAGIRKVRLGTFEDSGKCKGWAFVDFHLPAQATRALLNLHNHQLNGRKLNVEYASAEAVRRGAVGTKSGGGGRGNAGPRRRGGAPREDGQEGGEDEFAERGKKRRERDWDDTDVKALAAQAGADAGYDGPPPHARREPKPVRDDARKGRRADGGGGGGGGKRPKPGAALAMAQRASEGIVQSTGKKITFD